MIVEVVYENPVKTYGHDQADEWWWRWTGEQEWRPYEGGAFRAPDGTWIGDPRRREIRMTTATEVKEPAPAQEDFEAPSEPSFIPPGVDEELAARAGQLALPGFEHDPDELELAFTGTIKLNRKDPADVALIRRLKLFKEVRIEVSAFVSARAEKGKRDEEGNPEATLRTAVTVTDVLGEVNVG